MTDPGARIVAFLELLRGDAPIDRETRDEIARELADLWCYRNRTECEREGRRRGAPAALATWKQAVLVATLHEMHGATIDEAIAATLPDGTLKDHDRLSRAYRRLNVAGAPPVAVPMSDDQIDNAVTRLRGGQK